MYCWDLTLGKEKAINFWVILRILVGCVFLVSGVEKLLNPYQNFLYVVQSYAFLPSVMENLVARIFPWVEFILAVFLILGLWLQWILRVLLVLVLGFIFMIAQAIIRKLPITDCGCFGELIHLPLSVVIVTDSMLWMGIAGLLRWFEKAAAFSLDRYIEKN